MSDPLALPNPADVCSMKACLTDGPCRKSGRCFRRYPWRKTVSAVLDGVISRAEAGCLLDAPSLERHIAYHQAINNARAQASSASVGRDTKAPASNRQQQAIPGLCP